jgi:cytochrome bd-type quinol oxidase subunit 2
METFFIIMGCLMANVCLGLLISMMVSKKKDYDLYTWIISAPSLLFSLIAVSIWPYIVYKYIRGEKVI